MPVPKPRSGRSTSTSSSPGTGMSPSAADAEAEAPSCPGCGTDEFLHFQEYIPARTLPDRRQEPARAAYTCSRCGSTRTHHVPDMWTPPDWDWFA
jgi:ribosomal protein S27AE